MAALSAGLLAGAKGAGLRLALCGYFATRGQGGCIAEYLNSTVNRKKRRKMK